MIDLSLDNKIINSTALDEALQEIDILFSTENTELICDTDFGTDFEQFLWVLSPSLSSFREYVNGKLLGLTYLNQFKYDLEIGFAEGEIRSIYVLSLKIYVGEDEYITKNYEFR